MDPNLALTIEENGHTPPHASTIGVRVPMYDTVVRLNLRDGLWYEAGVNGNIPLTWNDAQQVWIPNYDPNQWPALGVDAVGLPEAPPSNTVLRMDGAVGTYTRTPDSAYLDYTYGFTLTATLAADDWAPWNYRASRVIVSKWGAVGQRSYYWAISPSGGLLLATSEMEAPKSRSAWITTSLSSVTKRWSSLQSASPPTPSCCTMRPSSGGMSMVPGRIWGR